MTEYCIHAANIFYLVSFLSRDMLWLRLLTCAGLSLGVIFFTTCSTPMYGPAGWHVVFLAINAWQIRQLFVSRRKTDLPVELDAISEAALEDLSREELVVLLTHEMSGHFLQRSSDSSLNFRDDLEADSDIDDADESQDEIDVVSHTPLDADEEVLKELVLERLSRREIVNLLARRGWASIYRRFRRKRRKLKERPALISVETSSTAEAMSAPELETAGERTT